MSVFASATGVVEAMSHSVPASPAFYIALVLYGLASAAYMGVFIEAPKWVVRVANVVLLLGFVAHGTDIGWRGVQAVHPGTSVREAIGFLAWLIVGGFLVGILRYRFSVLGAVVSAAGFILLAAARLSPSGEAVTGLTAIGRIHISLATLGVALFALATVVAVLYLLEDRNLKRKRFGGPLFKRSIALDTLDRVSHRLVLAGFPVFTLSLLLGIIWVSQRSMSSFNRVEYPLALITWISFGGLLAARTARGWRGRRAAIMTVVGFLAAMLVLVIYLARRAVL